jgi:hypothetical protein
MLRVNLRNRRLLRGGYAGEEADALDLIAIEALDIAADSDQDLGCEKRKAKSEKRKAKSEKRVPRLRSG